MQQAPRDSHLICKGLFTILLSTSLQSGTQTLQFLESVSIIMSPCLGLNLYSIGMTYMPDSQEAQIQTGVLLDLQINSCLPRHMCVRIYGNQEAPLYRLKGKQFWYIH
ncbi:hypothetical protein FGO68_gene4658 [Halteria grandinella]|uniref:Uncharacterized protein n=1 Tax=Halteria grandinella TaxID=5974 RepID=A0A8J8P6J6_HALGN|nr:hypothetical protein FGO68_gene4658 [Halteria grandinella]